VNSPQEATGQSAAKMKEADKSEGFLRKNAVALCSLFVAGCSAFVAALSLFYTIEAQRRDAKYREATIWPKLIIEVYPTDFGIGIRNQGLGPAVIKRIAVRVSGECYDSSNSNKDSFYKVTTGFMESTEAFFEQALFPVLSPLSSQLFTFKNFPVVGEIIPGQSTFMIRHLTEPSQQLLEKVKPAALVAASTIFRDSAYKMPLTIEYCSITGLTCDITSIVNDDCDLN
jgi:hypothetical protein